MTRTTAVAAGTGAPASRGIGPKLRDLTGERIAATRVRSFTVADPQWVADADRPAQRRVADTVHVAVRHTRSRAGVPQFTVVEAVQNAGDIDMYRTLYSR